LTQFVRKRVRRVIRRPLTAGDDVLKGMVVVAAVGDRDADEAATRRMYALDRFEGGGVEAHRVHVTYSETGMQDVVYDERPSVPSHSQDVPRSFLSNPTHSVARHRSRRLTENQMCNPATTRVPETSLGPSDKNNDCRRILDPTRSNSLMSSSPPP
jgi:hypothetical protein